MFVLCAEAVRTYYNSAAGTEKLKCQDEAKCVKQRRTNRLKRVCVPSSCIMHMSCVAMQKLTLNRLRWRNQPLHLPKTKGMSCGGVN